MSDVPVTADAPAASEAPEVAEVNESSEGQESSQVQAKEVVPSTKKKLKLKIDDKEEDFEIDLSDEKELTRHMQMSKVAQKRMQESAKIKKEQMEFITQLKSNPEAVLNDPRLGLDFRKIAEDYLTKQLEEQMLTPEEKKLRKAEEIIREREEADRKSREESEAQEMNRLQNHYTDHYQKVIIDQLQSGGVPKTRSTVKRMQELLKKNIDLGLDLDPAQIAKLVQEDYRREIREMFEAQDEDSLLSMMGDTVSNKIRKADLKRLKANQPKPYSTSRPEQSSGPQSDEKLSPEEFRERIRRKLQD